MKKKMKNLKSVRAVTLVALVVTIIVLIILAGVSISLILGENGIIKKAGDAKQNYQKAAEEEGIGLNALYAEMNQKIRGNTNSSALEILETATKPNGQQKDGVGVDEDGNILNLDEWKYEITGQDTFRIYGVADDPGSSFPEYETAYSGNKTELKILKYIKINNKIYTITEIGELSFIGNYQLTRIYIPDTITTIGNSAFYDCQNLQTIVIPHSVVTIGIIPFRSCTNLSSIKVIGYKEEEKPSGWSSSWNEKTYNQYHAVEWDYKGN